MNTFPISKPSSTNRISSSFSRLDSFSNRCQIHLEQLLEFRFEFDSIEQIFNEDQIWKDQIEDSISNFKSIQNVTRSIPRLFGIENQHYPVQKDSRYRIIVNSQYIHHQLIEAIDLARELEIKSKLSKKTTQKNIKYVLSQIKSNLDDLIQDLEYSIP